MLNYHESKTFIFQQNKTKQNKQKQTNKQTNKTKKRNKNKNTSLTRVTRLKVAVNIADPMSFGGQFVP